MEYNNSTTVLVFGGDDLEDQFVGRLVVAAAKASPVSMMGEDLYFWLDESLSCCVSVAELLAEEDSLARIMDTDTENVLEIVLGGDLKKKLLDHTNI